jgi:hypothetical protein
LSDRIKLKRLPLSVVAAESYLESNNPRLSECRGKLVDVSCNYGSIDSNKSIIIWADSHADQLMVMLDTIGKEINVEIKEVAFPGCLPLLDSKPLHADSKLCIQNNNIINAILMSDDTDVAILHAYWQYYIDAKKNCC